MEKKKSILLAAVAVSMLMTFQPAKAANVGSWTDLQQAIVNGTTPIDITGDITAGGNLGTLGGSNNTVTINGNGFNINGNGNQGITISNDQSLNIDKVGLESSNGFNRFTNSGDGGVIYNSGTVTIENSTLSGNSAYSGGAITNASKASLTINNALFASNNAADCGGAIINNSGDLVITNSTFIGNSANSWGGALYNNIAETTIIDSSFYGNSGSAGGAITSIGTLNIIADSKNVEFTGNTRGDGTSNAIHSFNNTINLNAGDSASVVFNDAISVHRGTNIININSNNVQINSDLNSPVYAQTTGTVEINNKVEKHTVNLYDGTLKLGHYEGGTIDVNGTQQTVAESVGSLDETVNFNVHGGTLSLQDGGVRTTNIGNVTLSNDLQLAIDAATSGTDMITANSFNADGHKILISDINLGSSKSYTGTAISTDSNIYNNVGLSSDIKLSGDGLANTNSLISYDNTTGTLTAGASTLKDAVNGTEADRIYTMHTDEIVTSGLGSMGGDGSTLTINGNGYDIIADADEAAVVPVYGIELYNNRTLNINNVGKPADKNSKGFNGFNTSPNGGVISNYGAVDVTNSKFSENSASRVGGVIANSRIVTIAASIFTGNSAGTYGGAISNSGTATITDSTFTGNSADQGGAIDNWSTANIIANESDTTFTGNTANGQSNALYNDYGTANLNAADGHKIVFNDGIDGSNGTININGVNDIDGVQAPTTGTVEFNNTVKNNTVNLYDGTLKLGHYEGGTIDVNGTSKEVAESFGSLDSSVNFVVNGGKLSVENDGTTTQNLGNVTLNTDLSTEIALDTIGSNSLLSADSVTSNNDSKIVISDINLGSTEGLLSNKVITTDTDILNNITISEDVTISGTNLEGKNTLLGYTMNDTTLALSAGASTLQQAVADSTANRTFDMQADETVASTLGSMGGGSGATLTINGGGNDINGSGHQGIRVNSGQSLNINNVGNPADENSKGFNGFSNSYGGLIQNESGSVIIQNSYINSNIASQYGGGVIDNKGNLQIISSYISNNSASKYSGGAIHNTHNGTAAITDSTFTGNKAKYGGAIENSYGTVSLSARNANVVFSGNSANKGGAISNSDTLNMDAAEGYKILFDAATKDDAGNIIASNDIYNDGTMNLNSGTIEVNSAINGNGTANIKNGAILTLGENSSLTQNQLTVDAASSFTNPVTVTVNSLINDGQVTNNKDITVNGNLTNNGTFINNSSLTIGYGTISGNAITGEGGTTYIAANGYVDNLTAISQAVNIASGADLTNSGSIGGSVTNAGTLTSNANNISGTVENNDTYNITGGTISQAISGTGTTNITGSGVINNSTISQDINITSGGGLTSDAGSLGSTISNSGTLNLSGVLNKEISGEGTTNIDSTIAFTDSASVDGTLNMNSGTLDLQNNEEKITSHEISKLEGSGNVMIDADFSGENPDADKLVITGSGSNANINISNINVVKDAADDMHEEQLLVIDGSQGGDISNINYSAGEAGSSTTYTNDYRYIFTAGENGNLNVDIDRSTASLSDFITQQVTGDTYSLTRDENIFAMENPADIGTTAKDGMVVNLNGHNLVGVEDDTAEKLYNGITVADGHKLDVDGDGGTVKNFNTAFTVNENGTLNLSDVNFANNNTDVANNGTLNLSGNNSITGGITGQSGQTNITDGKTTISDDIENAVSVSTGATLEGSADHLDNTVANDGNLNLTGGTIANAVTGAGNLNVQGDVKNSSSVEQANVTVEEGQSFTNDGSLIVSGDLTNSGSIVNNKDITVSGDLSVYDTADDFVNDGNLTFNGADSTIYGVITGEGTTHITGTVTNGSLIEQAIDIAGGGTFVTSADGIDGDVTNAGTLEINGGELYNTVSGSGNTNITGQVTNNSVITQNTVNVTKNADLINNNDINANVVNAGKLTSSADNIKGTVNNTGDYNVTGGTISNAITGSGNINLNLQTTLDSTINGNTINLNNGGILTLSQNANIAGAANLYANGGALSLQNGAIQNTNLGNLTLNSDLDLRLDGNFAQNQLDTISANKFNANGNNINISNILILEPTTEKSFSISPIGTGMDDSVRSALAGAIQYTGGDIAYSPIYKYSASYDPATAMMNFGLYGGGGGGGYDSFNPEVFAAPVAAQLGGYLVQLNAYDNAFRNMDMYMLMTKEQRQAMKMRNRYATTNKDIVFDPTVTMYENKAGWFRPYATFENVSLNNGPKVSNVAYGSFFGAESELYDLGHGWDGMWGVYGGYNGSHQAYDGVSIYQNGGTFGAVGMAYKGNFFTGLTANVGASAGEASSMFGHEDFAMLMSGVASKTGYNWELANGKFIIQPSLLMSYSFINTFDYRNAAGVSIDSDPLHAIQLEPGIKFIGNLKNGWQPYLGVSVVWNIMDRTHFQANNVALPNLSIDPFVKYGVGVRKSWGERFTGFFQTYITNGGRNGVGLQAGFRWTLGKSEQKQQKANQTPELPKAKITLKGNK